MRCLLYDHKSTLESSKHIRIFRFGLTLLELVVVLGILAVLAGVAVQSLEPLGDQARIDATQRTLQAIDKAIYSEYQDSDGRLVIRGFVADVGRLPRIDEGKPTLHELYTPATDEANLETADPAYQNLWGWKGPYLESTTTGFNPNERRLIDGWGKVFEVATVGYQEKTASYATVTNLSCVKPNSLNLNSPTVFASQDYMKLVQASISIDINTVDSNGNSSPFDLVNGEELEIQVIGPMDGFAKILAKEIVNEGTANSSVDESLKEKGKYRVNLMPLAGLVDRTSGTSGFAVGSRTIVATLTGTDRASSQVKDVVILVGSNIVKFAFAVATASTGGNEEDPK